MARTIFVGDVHGCHDELVDLLSKLGWSREDRLVMVGDLVVRGPNPTGVLDLLMQVGARSVRGNHEDRLLSWRRSHGRYGLGNQPYATARSLKKQHWEWLASLPLTLALPEHGVRVAHAGLAPGVPVEQQTPRALMYMRTLDRDGNPQVHGERTGRSLWAPHYEGPEHVVFGHYARPQPQLHAHATGLDTGCVYGGRLTAMVLEPGQRPPPPEERAQVLHTVDARRSYV
jgi:hypothetical protein